MLVLRCHCGEMGSMVESAPDAFTRLAFAWPPSPFPCFLFTLTPPFPFASSCPCPSVSIRNRFSASPQHSPAESPGSKQNHGRHKPSCSLRSTPASRPLMYIFRPNETSLTTTLRLQNRHHRRLPRPAPSSRHRRPSRHRVLCWSHPGAPAAGGPVGGRDAGRTDGQE